MALKTTEKGRNMKTLALAIVVFSSLAGCASPHQFKVLPRTDRVVTGPTFESTMSVYHDLAEEKRAEDRRIMEQVQRMTPEQRADLSDAVIQLERNRYGRSYAPYVAHRRYSTYIPVRYRRSYRYH